MSASVPPSDSKRRKSGVGTADAAVEPSTWTSGGGSTAGANDAPSSFEEALAELERIVATMESGKLTLDEALVAHQRGLVLARQCQSALARAREQVRILEEETLRVLPGSDDSDG